MQESQTSNQQQIPRGREGNPPTSRPPAIDRRMAIEKANQLATEQRFIYRGSAVALAARFEQPQEYLIPAQASSCLPGGGGLAEGLAEDFRQDLVSFRTASSRAEGLEFKNRSGHRFQTTVEASVEDLEIAGRLEAEKLEVSLISRHSPEQKHPDIIPGDMPGLQVFSLDGHEIRVEFALDIFRRLGSYKKLRRAYAEDDRFFEEYGHLFFNHKARKRKPGFSGWLEKKLYKKRRKLPARRGYLLCTIVRRIVSSHPEAKVYGNVIELAGFGRLTLGEMIIDRDTRRLALMRFQLDPGIGTNGEPRLEAPLLSDDVSVLAGPESEGTRGEGEVGCVGTNGHCYPC